MFTLPATATATGPQSAKLEDGVRSLIDIWQRVLPRPAAAAVPSLAALADVRAAGAESPSELRPLGCGWFDSSHDLQCGLRVQELSPVQVDAQALPLGVWLDLQAA